MYFLFGFFLALAFIPVPTYDLFPDTWMIVTLVVALISGLGFHTLVKGDTLSLDAKEKKPSSSAQSN